MEVVADHPVLTQPGRSAAHGHHGCRLGRFRLAPGIEEDGAGDLKFVTISFRWHRRGHALVPDACELVEGVGVAVQRDNAEKVAARRPEDPAAQPLTELDGP